MEEAAIVGAGCTGFRSITPEVSYKELMIEARAYLGFYFTLALYDKLRLKKIQGRVNYG
jgi:hypothetical protein